MLKEFKEFFTGGPEVQEARETIKRIERRGGALSTRNRRIVSEAHGITRRHFLTLAGKTIALTVGAAIGGDIFYNLANKSEPQKTLENQPKIELTPNPLLAEKIRQQIKDFEAKNYDVATEETAKQLMSYIVDLYRAEFAKEPPQKEVLIIDNQFLREKNVPEEQIPKVPAGDAGLILVTTDDNGAAKNIIPIIIYAGEPTTNDPSINKLSVFRALIMHEFIHAQTIVSLEQETVTIGKETFKAKRRRGFKWVDVETQDSQIAAEVFDSSEIGHYLDELNTQLMAEYLNDPTGKDQIWKQMNTGPVYVHSLETVYVVGADLLSKIYAKLGISVEEIESLHFKAEPQKLLERIDSKVAALGINLSQPASTTLLSIKPKNPEDIGGLADLKKLASEISGENPN